MATESRVGLRSLGSIDSSSLIDPNLTSEQYRKQLRLRAESIYRGVFERESTALEDQQTVGAIFRGEGGCIAVSESFIKAFLEGGLLMPTSVSTKQLEDKGFQDIRTLKHPEERIVRVFSYSVRIPRVVARDFNYSNYPQLRAGIKKDGSDIDFEHWTLSLDVVRPPS